MNQQAARSEDAVWQLARGMQLWSSSSTVNCPAGTFLCHLLALSSVSSFRPYSYWSLRTRLRCGLDWSWIGAFLARPPAAALLCVSQQAVGMLVLCVFAWAAWRRLGVRTEERGKQGSKSLERPADAHRRQVVPACLQDWDGWCSSRQGQWMLCTLFFVTASCTVLIDIYFHIKWW